jgi:hypothetical protein
MNKEKDTRISRIEKTVLSIQREVLTIKQKMETSHTVFATKVDISLLREEMKNYATKDDLKYFFDGLSNRLDK